MTLEIISPSATASYGEVKLLQLPGKTGSFEILYNHAPMIALLTKGKIKMVGKSEKISFIEINGGTLKVENNKIIILAD